MITATGLGQVQVAGQEVLVLTCADLPPDNTGVGKQACTQEPVSSQWSAACNQWWRTDPL